MRLKLKASCFLAALVLFMNILIINKPLYGQATVQFTDVSTAAGIDGDFYSTNSIHSLGMNWIDFDNDNWPDLFMINGKGLTAHLYHNERNGTFSNQDNLLPALPDIEMSGSVFADYDNDGDSDIYIFTDSDSFGLQVKVPPDGPVNLLLKNLWVENGNKFIEGQPLFQEVAASAGLEDLAQPPLGLLPGMRAKSGGWVDYDRDGFTDMYVGHMMVNSFGHEGNRDRLYRNQGDGTFEDVTELAGISASTDTTKNRPTLAFIAGHLDNDLWPDLYAINVGVIFDTSASHYDIIYQNNGGTFTDISALSQPGATDSSEAGMGIDLADIDFDGDWDFYISDLLNPMEPIMRNADGNVLNLGNGDGTFQPNSAAAAGVVGLNSWGVNFFDVDQDSDEDLLVVTISSANNLSLLYLNDGSGNFTDISTQANLTTFNGRGSATADYDRDGDLDIAIINEGGSLALFRNDTVNPGNWLQLQLVAVQSNQDAIGTLIEIQAGPLNLKRQVEGGSSAHSQDELVMHFGLGTETLVQTIEMFWPSGVVDTIVNVPVNDQITVIEGLGYTPNEYRVNCAGTNYAAGNGEFFLEDQANSPGAFGFVGGKVFNVSNPIGGTSDDSLYQSIRFDNENPFSYKFDVPTSGNLDVSLHLMAPALGVGNFIMDVSAEGAVILDDFDINATAGGTFLAHIETFTVNVSDGTLDLDFVIVNKGALVSAIEVVPNVPGPNIQVSPLSLDFGQVVTNESSDLTVTVTNAGNAVLNVSGLNITNTVFSLVNPPALPFPVAANGGTQVLTVRFSPTAVSMESGNLEIVSDDPDEPSVNVSLDGEGINQPPPQEYRINSGGPTYTAINSNVFSADQAYTPASFGFVGGKMFNFANAIGGTNDDPLYQDVRFNNEGPFSYRFDVSTSGNYDVSLHLMAPALGVGNFIMDVSAEGAVILDDFDINTTAGGTFLAHIETFTVNVTDGTLDLDFVTVNKAAIVCAIEVVEQSNAPSLTKETPLHEPIVSEIPREFHLFQNHPNPFNPETEIRFQLPEASRVIVTIFNTLGQEIRTLMDRQYELGFHSIRWDGKDNNGHLVASGIYLYQLQAGSFSQIRKMTLLR